MTLGALMAFEGGLMLAGVQPDEIPPEPALWLEQYSRIGGGAQVVFAGSSRTQQGVSPVHVAQSMGINPERVFNLGTSAGPGLPMLEHFAAREDFKDNVLIVEILPTHDFGIEESPMQRACLAKLNQSKIYLFAELWVSRVFHTGLRTGRRDGNPLNLLRELTWKLRGEDMPAARIPQVLHANRWREITIPEPDETTRELDARGTAVRFESWGRPLTDWRLRTILDRFEVAAKRLESRGVSVMLGRFPSDSWVAGVEERRFPRAQTFDLLAARLPGRCWDWSTDPVTSRLYNFDGSHLRGPDAKVFSLRLGELLKERLEILNRS